MKPILDHGYLRFIESWGRGDLGGAPPSGMDDLEVGIIEAARMSTNKGFLGWNPGEGHKGDAQLLKYLYENKHATPFEFAGLIIEVQAPIMVFREWHRHRTQSYNEMSARYTPMPDVHYLPSAERCLFVGGKNRQAGAADGANQLTHEMALDWLGDLADLYEHSQKVYQKGLRIGIPKELARGGVVVFRYSRMRAQASLRNWLAFMTLRSAPNAQHEIRVFAEALGEIIAEQFPRTWELFKERT